MLRIFSPTSNPQECGRTWQTWLTIGKDGGGIPQVYDRRLRVNKRLFGSVKAPLVRMAEKPYPDHGPDSLWSFA